MYRQSLQCHSHPQQCQRQKLTNANSPLRVNTLQTLPVSCDTRSLTLTHYCATCINDTRTVMWHTFVNSSLCDTHQWHTHCLCGTHQWHAHCCHMTHLLTLTRCSIKWHHTSRTLILSRVTFNDTHSPLCDTHQWHAHCRVTHIYWH